MSLLDKYRNSRTLYRYYKRYFIPTLGRNINSFRTSRFYLSNKLYTESSDNIHLKAAMEWLALAHDKCNRLGVSASYNLENGWDVAYPETSGYIIATFIEYSKLYCDLSYFKRAVEIGDWEIDIQTNNGGILSNPKKSTVRVFNTGQVILGWCLLYEHTQDIRYLKAACKAGDFLCITQEKDGRWVNNTYCGPRTYHARIDWALLRLYQLTGNEVYRQKAEKNIVWVLDQQKPNGWFENCGFNEDLPIMHTLVYTLRGLLECHSMNIEEIVRLDILQKLLITANNLNEFISSKPVLNIKGLIPTSFQNNWLSDDKHSCLTGNAQYSIFLYRLAQLTNDKALADLADVIISGLKKTQKISMKTNEQNIVGAIPGSFPIYNGYCINSFPNWATKFFADGLMMKKNFTDGLIIKA